MQVGDFASALVPATDAAQRGFRLILPKESDQRAALVGSGTAAPAFAGRNYRTVRIGTKVLKPIWEKGDATPWVSGVLSDRIPALEFFETPDPKPQADARHAFGTGNWAVLHALENGAQRGSDGKKWDVLVTLRDAQGESRLQLSFELDAPLPPLDQWPK
jgi:hypothetical protein